MSQMEDNKIEKYRHEMRQLIYLFSHDMRNPLVNMKALLHEMRASLQEVRRGKLQLLEQEIPDTLEMFEQTVARMNTLINGANEIYHCMFDDIECEEVDLQALVERVVNRFGSRAGIEFSVERLPAVWADPLAMSRIIEQLLDNAVHAMAANGGVITIAADSSEGSDLLLIRDTGQWMSEEEMQGIFNPFCSLSDSAPGMGLAMVKALVEAHGGSVWCESGPGEGSVFYVRLPQRRAQG